MHILQNSLTHQLSNFITEYMFIHINNTYITATKCFVLIRLPWPWKKIICQVLNIYASQIKQVTLVTSVVVIHNIPLLTAILLLRFYHEAGTRSLFSRTRPAEQATPSLLLTGYQTFRVHHSSHCGGWVDRVAPISLISPTTFWFTNSRDMIL